MSVDSAAMSLVILPFAFINITVSVNQAASTVCLVVLPVAFVARAVEPDLDTATITNVLIFNPFTFILGTIF
jgi:hypothetical protein